MSIAKRMDDIPFSGIRKVFEKVGAMEAAGHEVIHMEIGRPDFGTPDHIVHASKQALDQGKVHYTSNYGIPELRQAVVNKLRSDNGPCYVSTALKEYLDQEGMAHTRGKPFHPMTQGKIERYHRSMKNVLFLENYYSPDELVDQIVLFIEYYNHQRYHEALNDLIPVDGYYGKAREIMARRERIRKTTMLQRRRYNRSLMVA